MSKLRDIPLAVVDVETTGASAQWGDRVIEIGLVRVEGGRTVDEYQQLIDPQRPISRGITALTGISPDMCDGQPLFEHILPNVIELMQGAVVIGHNVRFDLSFLRKEFRACGRDLHDVFGRAHVMDTVRIARRRFGRGGNGLQTLAPRLGIQPPFAHRALADAQTTAAVFDRLLEPVGGWDLCLCDALVHQGGPMSLTPLSARESLLPLELEEALDARKPVLMDYLDARDARTQRVINPIQVKRFKGELILVAHCHLRNDRRTFKLERIVQLTRIDPDAQVPPAALECPEGEPDMTPVVHDTQEELLFPSNATAHDLPAPHQHEPVTPASEL
ncbi:MAG TPA: exonuclease domain-containing protein [Tepidisphaeraceae bacterium]|nr:exonuclease domain-containing protein [Tepidisphaeraceae bacterium]